MKAENGNKHYLALSWEDILNLEEEILDNISKTDNEYFHGMLEVIRWMKEKNVYQQNIYR